MRKLILWLTFGSLLAFAIALGIFFALHANTPTYQAGLGGVGYPSCIYCPNPTYSENALKAHYEGEVLLSAVINSDGRASKIMEGPKQGLGIEKMAVEALQRWRFNPAPGPAGTPVAVKVPIQIAFHLPTPK